MMKAKADGDRPESLDGAMAALSEEAAQLVMEH